MKCQCIVCKMVRFVERKLMPGDPNKLVKNLLSKSDDLSVPINFVRIPRGVKFILEGEND